VSRDGRSPASTDLALAGLAVIALGLAVAMAEPRSVTDAGDVPALPAVGLQRPAREPHHSADAPIRLELPALRRSAPVVAVGVDRQGRLTVPAETDVVGWWSGGAEPGDAMGTVVLAGHVDSTAGPGVLFDLGTLEPGAAIHLDTAAGRHNYRVVARRVYRKTALPAEVFDQGVPGRLVLITCTGRFHNGNYDANLVVYAQPTTTG
jgi:hypothetical protein